MKSKGETFYLFKLYFVNIFTKEKKRNIIISDFNFHDEEYCHMYLLRPLLAILYNIIALRCNIVFSCEQGAVRISEDELIAIAITRSNYPCLP